MAIGNSIVDNAVKPRVLIADDSRIVRATLIKHIDGAFEFREALDGEQAWETLLLDPSIRVVITDLTMPKLDGYGLLKRIRASKVSRIRNVPVIVISGSDEQAERERAKSFGATDLITKGIGTAQLLSRLDILTGLGNDQEPSPSVPQEVPLDNPSSDDGIKLLSLEEFQSQAEAMREFALNQAKNFVLLRVAIGVVRTDSAAAAEVPPEMVRAAGRLLYRTVRQTDCMAQSGEAEFTLASNNIHFDSARNFAQRVCNAIIGGNLSEKNGAAIFASCGMAALSEFDPGTAPSPSLAELSSVASRRSVLGLRQGVSGVVGAEEEALFAEKEAAEADAAEPVQEDPPDLATLLQWAKEGKQDLVMRHIGKFSSELQPLIALLNQAK